MMRSILEEDAALELQHINVKLSLQHSFDLDPVIPIFHEWIQKQIFDELLLDVADYRHVKDGPAIILIGHEADYSIDRTDGRLGLRYNRKAPLPGNNQERLQQATRSALNALRRLQTDTRLNGGPAFDGSEIEITINDRVLAPNNSETRNLVARDFQILAANLFQPGSFKLNYSDGGRRLFSVIIQTIAPHSVDELLTALQYDRH